MFWSILYAFHGEAQRMLRDPCAILLGKMLVDCRYSHVREISGVVLNETNGCLGTAGMK